VARPLFVRGVLDVAALTAEVATVEDGAICTFLGTARRTSDGKEVVELRYEAYQTMAEKTVQEIVLDAQRQFPGSRVAVQHRLGVCPLGEASVAVVAAAPHRGDALSACRLVIDRLKAEAAIWKQEVYRDGSAWVGDPSSRSSGAAAAEGRR
jgi:molybdopterin synthase catalytic subunit